jgi:hypothetical protein
MSCTLRLLCFSKTQFDTEERKLKVFVHKVLQKIYELKKDEVIQILHDEEVRDTYTSPSAVSIVKSRKLLWAGHVATLGKECTQNLSGMACWNAATWRSQKELG